MFELEVFIPEELGAQGGVTASAVFGGEVSRLEHEVRDDSEEGGPYERQFLPVLISLVSSAKSGEVSCCFGHDLSE